jgi:hypothetical protein
MRIRYAVYAGDQHYSDWATREHAQQSIDALAYLNLPFEIVELADRDRLALVVRKLAAVQFGNSASLPIQNLILEARLTLEGLGREPSRIA